MASHKSYLSVEKTMKTAGVTRAQAISVLRAAAAKGVGEFKIGRKGWPTRLQA